MIGLYSVYQTKDFVDVIDESGSAVARFSRVLGNEECRRQANRLCDLLNDENDTDIHLWFGLSYANYLVLHRSVLQSMPDVWQYEFTVLLEELDERAREAGLPMGLRYTVHVRDDNNRFMEDPIPHYNRGRTRIPGIDPSKDD